MRRIMSHSSGQVETFRKGKLIAPFQYITGADDINPVIGRFPANGEKFVFKKSGLFSFSEYPDICTHPPFPGIEGAKYIPFKMLIKLRIETCFRKHALRLTVLT